MNDFDAGDIGWRSHELIPVGRRVASAGADSVSAVRVVAADAVSVL